MTGIRTHNLLTDSRKRYLPRGRLISVVIGQHGLALADIGYLHSYKLGIQTVDMAYGNKFILASALVVNPDD